ncbi:retrovirus-related pol polyprotein from transposon TNT 1-94 [Tanacetum coccineum]
MFEENNYSLERSDDANDEPEDRELEAHYLYMAKIQEVTHNVADNSDPSLMLERCKILEIISIHLFDLEPTMVAEEDDEMSNEMRLDNSPKTNKGTEYNNQRASNIAGVRETVGTQMLHDDADDEPEDRELEAHYLYMEKIQEVTPDSADNSGLVFDVEPLQNLVEIILFIFDSGCSKHMTRNLKILSNFVNIFLGSHGTDLYSITLQDTSTPNPIFLMAKASSSQAWLWQRRLSHIKFDTINLLSKYDIVNGLSKLKFIKDHLCSSCELRKAKLESFNGKKYVLVIVDDHSRYTWTYFLRSKDETQKVLIDFLKLVQRGLHAQVRTVQTDKGT